MQPLGRGVAGAFPTLRDPVSIRRLPRLLDHRRAARAAATRPPRGRCLRRLLDRRGDGSARAPRSRRATCVRWSS